MFSRNKLCDVIVNITALRGASEESNTIGAPCLLRTIKFWAVLRPIDDEYQSLGS